MKKFIIIDALAILHRAWHALPKLTNKEGKIINAVYGFSSFLLKTLKEEKPDYLAVAYDTKTPSIRKKEFKEYKANRIPQPQEFYDQIPLSKKVLEAFSINFFSLEGQEADDLISSIAKRCQKLIKPYEIIIFTGDKDILQLINKKIKVALLKQNISQTKIYDKNKVEKEYGGLSPRQLIDFKALVGDPADNIPGVKGIGSRLATFLLKKYHSLENLYELIEKNKIKKEEIKERMLNALIKEKERAFLFKRLIKLRGDLKLKNFKLENCHLQKIDKEKIKKLFNEIGFKSLVSRLEALNSQQKSLF